MLSRMNKSVLRQQKRRNTFQPIDRNFEVLLVVQYKQAPVHIATVTADLIEIEFGLSQFDMMVRQTIPKKMLPRSQFLDCRG